MKYIDAEHLKELLNNKYKDLARTLTVALVSYLDENRLGWVSVKDRLPEVGHFVLTCVADTGTPQCVGMAILLDDGTWWDGDTKVCVDYWMEVPKLNEGKK